MNYFFKSITVLGLDLISHQNMLIEIINFPLLRKKGVLKKEEFSQNTGRYNNQE